MTTDHTLIIAEAGVNHNGSIELALKLIDAAAEAGADIVKFQTFKAADLVSRHAAKAEYQLRETSAAESQLEMLRRLELDEAAHDRLIKHCADRNIRFLSTPFDFDSLALLIDRFNMPTVKLGSGELTNAPLLLAVARTGRPAILSTGMATLDEVRQALGVMAFGYAGTNTPPSRAAFEAAYNLPSSRDLLARNVTLLHCTTEYPAPFADVNLRAMATLHDTFGLQTGYSDHTPGIAIPVAAAALGAAVIEKHFTLDRTMDGPDHRASLEPDELAAMVTAIRQVEAARGDGVKIPRGSELKNMQIARKGIVAARDIAAGETFSAENLAIKRPGTGRSAFDYWDLLGTPAHRAYKADQAID